MVLHHHKSERKIIAVFITDEAITIMKHIISPKHTRQYQIHTCKQHYILQKIPKNGIQKSKEKISVWCSVKLKFTWLHHCTV